MSRFSPTVLPDPGPDFSTELARALSFMRQSKLDKERAEEREWNREWLGEERERQREQEDLELAERGYDRFETPPTMERPATRPPLFEGQSLGMADRPEASPLAMALGDLRSGSGPEAKPLALPGQFIPELGDFSPGALFDEGSPLPDDIERIRTPDFNPAAYGSRPRMAPTMVDVPDPRYEHLTGSIYRDLEDNPQARAQAAAAEQQNLLAEALGTLRGGADAESSALARLMQMDDVPASVLERYLAPEEEEEEGLTAEELRMAGIEEPYLAVALKDPVLARRLIQEGLEPEETPEAPTIRVGGRTFPDTPQGRQEAIEWERTISAAGRAPRTAGTAGTEEEDPAFLERRRAIVSELGPPATEARQLAVNELAKGKTPGEMFADMKRAGVPDSVVEDVRRYIAGYGTSPFRIGG